MSKPACGATVPASLPDVQQAILDLIREKNIAVNNLTREQVGEAMLQAIECGDFTRYVIRDEDRQHVGYIPFRREQELLGRLKEIADLIERVDNRCAAADGPVTNTRVEMTDIELRKIYKLAAKG